MASYYWGNCNEFVTVMFPTVFKLFPNRVKASSYCATVIFFTVLKECLQSVNADLVFTSITYHQVSQKKFPD